MNAAPSHSASSGFFERAARFLRSHDGVAAESLVANLHIQIDGVGPPGSCVPVTVGDYAPDNTWVVSPYTAYCAYAIEELRRFRHPWLTAPLTGLCHGLAWYLKRAHIDRAVTINNWLLSTNLYPAARECPVERWVEEALDRWPGRAIWFRSLNRETNADWLATLQALGFDLMPSRQVYLFRDIAQAVASHSDFKSDLRVLRRSALARIDEGQLTSSDDARIAELYGFLYLDKYSRLNPQYTADFIALWRRAGLIDLTGFRDADGSLQAVVGTFSAGAWTTAPIVGYNTARPQKQGLYRILMASVLSDAARLGRQVNLSAGAAHFKRQRGGQPAIEYSAVLSRHLSRRTRRALAALRRIAGSIAVPIMEHYRL